ncbi:mediator of RNA polymerase II transcription subunit [Striga asiatica]|uniref:Mediator of RNA polymerase II transcription subunit n=1 Tax=Striga asiatica TaxID=4170 RepID=A0A5A7QHD2_STRAF|nr:mediator of RNA polymerase II transcription subunit [Striga asiatica]
MNSEGENLTSLAGNIVSEPVGQLKRKVVESQNSKPELPEINTNVGSSQDLVEVNVLNAEGGKYPLRKQRGSVRQPRQVKPFKPEGMQIDKAVEEGMFGRREEMIFIHEHPLMLVCVSRLAGRSGSISSRDTLPKPLKVRREGLTTHIWLGCGPGFDEVGIFELGEVDASHRRLVLVIDDVVKVVRLWVDSEMAGECGDKVPQCRNATSAECHFLKRVLEEGHGAYSHARPHRPEEKKLGLAYLVRLLLSGDVVADEPVDHGRGQILDEPIRHPAGIPFGMRGKLGPTRLSVEIRGFVTGTFEGEPAHPLHDVVVDNVLLPLEPTTRLIAGATGVSNRTCVVVRAHCRHNGSAPSARQLGASPIACATWCLSVGLVSSGSDQ